MRLRWIAAGATLMMASASADAAVVYKFSGGGARFTLIAPDFVSERTPYSPDQLYTCASGRGCTGVELFPITNGIVTIGGGEYSDAVRFDAPSVSVYTYFADGAFGRAGSYSATGLSPGMLQVWTSAVLYEFSTAGAQFALIAPGFITERSSYTPDRLESCASGLGCGGVDFFPITNGVLVTGGEFYDAVQFNVPGFGVDYYFADGAFSRPGTYSAIGFYGGTLKVTSLAAAVPEPASWAMMIAGFGIAGSSLRSRRLRNRRAGDSSLRAHA